MGDRVIRKIMEYLKAHRLKRNWQMVLTSLAAVVVFCTTYALILPAITLDRPRTATASNAGNKAEEKRATPTNVAASTTTNDDDPEAEVDLIFDLDYDMATRRFLTKSSRDLGVDVDMGVPEWMLSDWDDVPDFDGELTGIWSDDLLAVAESQVGYIADYEGKSYYGDWFGKPYGDWNAMFVSWCLDVAEVPENVIPRETSAAELADKLADMENTGFVEAEGHTPEAGNLIFFDTDGDGEADRVGIVAEYNARTGELKVIEGDYRTEIEWYETDDVELASSSNAEKATSSNAKKAQTDKEKTATPSDAEIRKPGRGGGWSDSTPGDADEAAQEVSPLGATIEKKVTPRLTAQEDEEEEDEEESSYDIISEAAIVSYDLEELLSGEENVSVVGYVLGASRSAGIDILDYVENYSDSHYGNPASATITVKDADNNVVEKDENGDYTLIAGDEYHIALEFYFEGGIEAGTYVYTFPEGITLTDGTGTVTVINNSGVELVLGTWTIDATAGTLTFVINEVTGLSTLSHITLSATASASFENAGDSITIGDITYQVIEETEDTSASLHKRAGEVYSEDGYITWEIQVDGGDDVGLAGQTITDTITTNNHEFTQDDIDDMTITIQDSEGTYHTLSVDDANLTWTETGWEITLPDEFTCKNCRETITLPEDDSTGWIIYIEYTTTITGSGSYATYGNSVTFNDVEKTGRTSTGEGGIDKGGVYNEGATLDDATITWTVDASIPGNSDGEQIYNWYIYDSEGVYVNGSRVQRYYNDLGVDSTTTTITAEISGQDAFTVPNLEDAANDGSDLIAWELHDTSTRDGYDYGRTIWFYCWDDENGEWSLWWQFEEDVVLTITYSSSVVYEDENLIEEYNAAGASLRNSVQLQNKGTDGNADNLVGDTSAEVDLPSVIDKELTDEPDSDNGYVVEYTVAFNETMADLSVYNAVEITDTMSTSLIYDKGSTVITAKDADGNTFTVTDYTVEYSSGTDSNVATITLNESALGPYEYTLVYNAKIDGSGTVSYSNAIEVTVFGKTFKDEVGAKIVNDVSASAQTYSVTLTKKDADTGATLAGAEFDVYNAETDALLTTVTTGNDGTATVNTNPTQGVIFSAHTLYYFIETKAPDGYVLDNTTKYYFWFCDVDGECSTCDAMKDELIAKEGADETVHEGALDSSQTEENINLPVPNSPGKEHPAPGGSGTFMYTMAGMLLTGCACFMYKDIRRKRRHEEV
ncbi:MAG: hypothetical protein LUE86_11610 [Clostridiales bacterium]|nr:hypothetical protein [Clostridiales bacterium]